MSDTNARAEGLGVTIKTGKGYDDTWLTFTGSPEQVRALIKETFELDDTDLTLFEVVQNATQTAHGVSAAVSGLKGRVTKGRPSTPADEAQQPSGGDVEQPSEEPPAEDRDPYDVLNEQIEAMKTVDDLRLLYANNSEMFTAETDQAKAAKKAWSAKGKALSKKA